MNVRVHITTRDRAATMAHELGVSMNRFVEDAITAALDIPRPLEHWPPPIMPPSTR